MFAIGNIALWGTMTPRSPGFAPVHWLMEKESEANKQDCLGKLRVLDFIFGAVQIAFEFSCGKNPQ